MPGLNDELVDHRRVDDLRETRRVEVACAGVDGDSAQVDVSLDCGELDWAEPSVDFE